MDGTVKQVKVDNWGIFFLQRLQQFYLKQEYCDLILEFAGNERLRVHRLVVNACTEYFQLLEKNFFPVNNQNVLRMPADLQADVVTPIINFMYTGRLEFRVDLAEQLYTTAQQMNMTVLTKLLDAQALPISQTNKLGSKQVAKKIPGPSIPYSPQVKKTPPKPDPNLPDTLPGRKLPIWKRRSAPVNPPSFLDESSSSSIPEHEGVTKVRADDPRPFRFEWPQEDNEDPIPYTTSFDGLSYESQPIMQPADVKPAVGSTLVTPTPTRFITSSPGPNKVASFEDLQRTVVNKRPAMTLCHNEVGAKKSKVVDLQAVKEYMEEHRLRKNLLDGEDSSEDVDDDLAVADMDDDDDEEEEALVQEVPPIATHLAIPQKSILKSQISHEETPSPSNPLSTSKKVRFSLDSASAEGKENTEAEKGEQLEKETKAQASTFAGATLGNSANLSNHAKIISEVLKKYPDLVKNNKNIKLKIMQRGGQQVPMMMMDGDANKAVKSKVSYVVLKSDMAGKGKTGTSGGVVLKRGGMVEPLLGLGTTQKPPSGAENVKGPWLCHSCGTNEEPVNFDTYYLYRRHLQDVHMEKIDARICEHCGHRASKRNLLLYHLYTKHSVPPPRNCQFPKCDQCEYVALSESLLIKHRHNHSNNREFICKVCNAGFKSNGALQGHMQTNLHSDPMKKVYECPVCQKPFVRNINLKAHIRTSHKDQPVPQGSEDGDVVEVPVVDPLNKVASGTANTAAQTLEPSSEAEAFSNVASGIAASLGLEQAVIVLEDSREFVLHNEETEVQEYVEQAPVSTTDSEFIVPDILGSEEQSYTEQQASQGVAMLLSDHDYAEDQRASEGVVILITQPGEQQQTVLVPVSSLQNFTTDTATITSGSVVQVSDGSLVQVSEGDVVQVSDGNVVQVSEGNVVHVSEGNVVRVSEGNMIQVSDGNVMQVSDGNVMQVSDGNMMQVSDGNVMQVSDSNVMQDSDDNMMQVAEADMMEQHHNLSKMGPSTGEVKEGDNTQLYKTRQSGLGREDEARRASGVEMADLVRDWDDFDENEEQTDGYCETEPHQSKEDVLAPGHVMIDGQLQQVVQVDMQGLDEALEQQVEVEQTVEEVVEHELIKVEHSL